MLSSIRNLPAPEVEIVAVDKIAHFLEYAVFAFLLYRSFSHFSSAVTAGPATLLALLVAVAFAFLDEYYQQFIPGRSADPYDLVADLLGTIVVLAYLFLRQRATTSRSSP